MRYTGIIERDSSRVRRKEGNRSLIVWLLITIMSLDMTSLTSLTSLLSLYPKGHRPMRKIHVE